MAIAATMSRQGETSKDDDHDPHDDDLVMPGFRFHPTEEELIEFYLRRKVEGKRFNVELITFLDLYRYDPWELPALAAIGEKEWFFYVPRDRKYRNGDRPNRVTTSGYWKATGADRMIRTENLRSIGLKKTLVFYIGKAPRGTRTSWIMNEYRLPQHETERLQKAEISLCRVYKRAGIEDHVSLPRSVVTWASTSRTQEADKKQQAGPSNHAAMETFQAFDEAEKMSETSGSSSTELAPRPVNLGLSKHSSYTGSLSSLSSSLPLASSMEDHERVFVDDLHSLMNFQQVSINHHHHHHQYNPSRQFATSHPQSDSSAPVHTMPSSLQVAGISDRLWDWSSITQGNKDYTSQFK